MEDSPVSHIIIKFASCISCLFVWMVIIPCSMENSGACIVTMTQMVKYAHVHPVLFLAICSLRDKEQLVTFKGIHGTAFINPCQTVCLLRSAHQLLFRKAILVPSHIETMHSKIVHKTCGTNHNPSN